MVCSMDDGTSKIAIFRLPYSSVNKWFGHNCGLCFSKQFIEHLQAIEVAVFNIYKPNFKLRMSIKK